MVFRTQSAALLQAMTGFFRLWKRIEDAHLAPLLGAQTEYALYDGKFTRTIASPKGRDCSAEDIASAISDYIKLFDALLKGEVCGSLAPQDVEAAYLADLQKRSILI